jgi:hypothetical protein
MPQRSRKFWVLLAVAAWLTMLLFAQTTAEVALVFGERLGPLHLERMALGQGEIRLPLRGYGFGAVRLESAE